MKKLLSPFELVLTVGPLLWLAISIVLTFGLSDWEWFSRAGAILCFSGAALPISSLLDLRRSAEEYAKENPGSFGFISAADWPPKKAVLGAKVSRFAFVLGTVGTLIWAYGDWVGRAVHPFHK